MAIDLTDTEMTEPARAIHGPAAWLCLAATPVFAVMALATAIGEASPAMALCGGTIAGQPIGGMALMYALMAVIHLAPWLRLVDRSAGGRRH